LTQLTKQEFLIEEKCLIIGETRPRLHGAKIYQQAEVTKLDLQPDGSWEITTPQGSIRAKRIVNATGFWGREFSGGEFTNVKGRLHSRFLRPFLRP
jgi:glycine/D-amino acid oxidase-like deaminating enzyme